MREELGRIDLSPIADLVRIKKEEQLLAERLKSMEIRAEKVSSPVYDRVRKDYETRRLALEQESRPLKEHARREYRQLQALRREVEQAVEAASFDKEEVEFRRELGEFPDGVYKERLATCEKHLADERQDLEAVMQMKATFLDAFRSEEDLATPDSGSEGPAPQAFPAQRPPVRPVPPAPPAAPAPLPVENVVKAPPPFSPPSPPIENVIKPPPPFGKPPAAEPSEPPEATVVLTRARLALLEGDRIAKEFPLKPGVSVLGRLALSDIHLPTPDVSRKHAQVIVGPSGVFVVDLESENGVVVNGRKVDKVQLVDGDVLTLGKQRLVFHG
ncbi:MAG: FHA domain-containing protein [Thermoanaerobaculia bacterium]